MSLDNDNQPSTEPAGGGLVPAEGPPTFSAEDLSHIDSSGIDTGDGGDADLAVLDTDEGRRGRRRRACCGRGRGSTCRA